MRYRDMRRPASIRASFRASGRVLDGSITDFSYSGLSVMFDERVKNGSKVALILKQCEHAGDVVHIDADGTVGIKFDYRLSKSQHQELVNAARNGSRATFRGLSEL